MNGSVRKPIQTLADRLMSRLGLSRQRQFYVDPILSIACTGHGASLAYMNSQGVLRSSVLDRWVGIKDTLMFSEREDRGIRHADSGLGKEIRDLLVYGFGKFPETKIFEDTVFSWT